MDTLKRFTLGNIISQVSMSFSIAALIMSSTYVRAEHSSDSAGQERPSISKDNELISKDDPFKECAALYPPGSGSELGEAVETPKPKKVYKRYDSYFSDLVYVTTNSDGTVDSRPLAIGTVMDCDAVGNPSDEAEGQDADGTDSKSDFSGRCILSKDSKKGFVKLRMKKEGGRPNTAIKKYTLVAGKDGANTPGWEIRTQSTIEDAVESETHGESSKKKKKNKKNFSVPEGSRLVKWKTDGETKYYTCPKDSHLESYDDNPPRLVKNGYQLVVNIGSNGEIIYRQVPEGTPDTIKPQDSPQNNTSPPPSNYQNQGGSNQYYQPQPGPPTNNYVPWSGGIQQQGWTMPRR